MSSDQGLENLMKVEGIKKKTAEQLIGIGILNPDYLVKANSIDIIQKFKNKKVSDKKYDYVPKNLAQQWIDAACKGDWKYSIASRRLNGIEKRCKAEGILTKAAVEERGLKWPSIKEILDDCQLIETKGLKTYMKKDWERKINSQTGLSDNDFIIIKNILQVASEDIVSSITKEDFRKFYGKDDDERACSYCGITEKEIDYLQKIGEIKTKRARGKYMEIDRIDPKGGYILKFSLDGVLDKQSNIAQCCYWCNNAKTDEFTDVEFMPIAEKIQEVWGRRGIERFRK